MTIEVAIEREEPNGRFFVVTTKDGVPHSAPIEPGHFTAADTFEATDLSTYPKEAQDFAATYWTKERLDLWKEQFPWKEPEPPPFIDLSRPAFLFMMNKIGVTEAQVEALIGQMPSNTPEQKDAKTLALIVFRNQQTFQRDNALLATLAAAAGLSKTTVDAAWRAAEQIKW